MRDVHSSDVKEEPLSEVMCSGTPNLETHADRKAMAQEAAEESTKATASGQRVVRSMIVNRYLWPSDGGKRVNVDVSKVAFGLREGSDA